MPTHFFKKIRDLLGITKNPYFIAGLILRIVIIVIFVPNTVVQWYAPFLSNSLEVFSIDPWETWLNQGGIAIAFPYGYTMWLFFLPAIVLCKMLVIPIAFGYGFSLIMADLGLLIILRKLLNIKDSKLLIFYWLSPISLIASYCLGYNDLVPVFLLMSAVYCLKDHRAILSGFFVVTAISAKFSMILSLPFFFIYLFNNHNLRQILNKYIFGVLIGAAFFVIPFLLSSSGLQMLANNPEIEKIYQLSISLVRNTSLYLVPLCYLLVLYLAWRVKRMNFKLFSVVLGMAFLLVVLLTPASLGWFIWILPLLVSYQTSGDRAAIYISSVFTLLYMLSATVFISTQQHSLEINNSFQALGLQSSIDAANVNYSHLASLIHTALVATGILLAVRIWRETITRNDFFRLSRKPFVIGVAGDSGAGKDTFANAISGLFGPRSVAAISGDDYHLWDRHQPMWEVMTHINPAANDLESFAKNLVAITDGRSIKAKHYDHHTGKMSKPLTIKSNNIIIASGLHALYLPILRECYDLSIYLEIDEDLRTFFKIQRDVIKRGYTVQQVLATLEKRKPDSRKFIHPQAAYADLILSLRPIHSNILGNIDDVVKLSIPPRMKLVVRSRHGFNELSLKRVLIGVCGLQVEMGINDDLSEIELSIEGETSSKDVQMAASMIFPQIFEFFDLNPEWQNGVLGLMQLITISHINQALTRRFI